MTGEEYRGNSLYEIDPSLPGEEVVRVAENSEHPERCLVRLFEKYMALR